MRGALAAAFVALLIVIALSTGFAQTSSPVSRTVLDNGLTVVVKPEPGSGLVAVVAMIRAGANQESIQTTGIGNFVSKLLLQGTTMSSAEEVANVAYSVGGNIGSYCGPDFAEIRLVTTSAMFNRAMSLLGESLTTANFEQKYVERTRTDILKDLAAESDDLFQTSYATLRELLYEDNGYRRPTIGTERTARLATPADLSKFYSAYYLPQNMVISVVGDVTVDQALDRARKIFAGLPTKRMPVDRGVPDEKLERSKFRASEVDISTAYLMLAWLAPTVKSPDSAAAAVAANALGGGKGSLMFRELRQKRGMGYDLGTVYPRHRYQSHILAYVVTDPFKMTPLGQNTSVSLDDVKAALLEQVETLKDKPLSTADLERAKGYTIGSYALAHQRPLDRAYEIGWLEAAGVSSDMYDKFPEMIRSVTAEDVQRVAKKYFTNYAAVLLLPKTGSQQRETEE